MGTCIGTGIYGLTEAAKLTGVSRGRISYWIRGREYRLEKGLKKFPPKWPRQLPIIDNEVALGFLDLMRVRFVDAFLRAGVSWKVVNRASAKAAKRFKRSHPFSWRKFKTDGHTIFVESIHEEEEETRLLDIVADQHCLNQILQPYFYEGVEFDDDGTAYRWFPAGHGKLIVLDPARAFGQPIVAAEGVPTQVIFQAHQAFDSSKEIARWYNISEQSVRAAIQFETGLAAA